MRLLVVEDNRNLADLICAGLARAGFDCDIQTDAAGTLAAVKRMSYAAMILDLGLPDRDGLDVLRELRQADHSLPIIIMTARGGLEDRIGGLEEGADDFLVKPVAIEELVARIQALLRRPSGRFPNILQVGNLSFDPLHRQVFVAGRPQTFNAREISVLELLIRRCGEVVGKQFIEEQLFGTGGEVSESALEIAVFRLRRRLEGAEADVAIHNVRGVGYLLTEKPAAL